MDELSPQENKKINLNKEIQPILEREIFSGIDVFKQGPMGSDALFLARFAIKKIAELEQRIEDLEKKP